MEYGTKKKPKNNPAKKPADKTIPSKEKLNVQEDACRSSLNRDKKSPTTVEGHRNRHEAVEVLSQETIPFDRKYKIIDNLSTELLDVSSLSSLDRTLKILRDFEPITEMDEPTYTTPMGASVSGYQPQPANMPSVAEQQEQPAAASNQKRANRHIKQTPKRQAPPPPSNTRPVTESIYSTATSTTFCLEDLPEDLTLPKTSNWIPTIKIIHGKKHRPLNLSASETAPPGKVVFLANPFFDNSKKYQHDPEKVQLAKSREPPTDKQRDQSSRPPPTGQDNSGECSGTVKVEEEQQNVEDDIMPEYSDLYEFLPQLLNYRPRGQMSNVNDNHNAALDCNLDDDFPPTSEGLEDDQQQYGPEYCDVNDFFPSAIIGKQGFSLVDNNEDRPHNMDQHDCQCKENTQHCRAFHAGVLLAKQKETAKFIQRLYRGRKAEVSKTASKNEAANPLNVATLKHIIPVANKGFWRPLNYGSAGESKANAKFKKPLNKMAAGTGAPVIGKKIPKGRTCLMYATIAQQAVLEKRLKVAGIPFIKVIPNPSRPTTLSTEKHLLYLQNVANLFSPRKQRSSFSLGSKPITYSKEAQEALRNARGKVPRVEVVQKPATSGPAGTDNGDIDSFEDEALYDTTKVLNSHLLRPDLRTYKKNKSKKMKTQQPDSEKVVDVIGSAEFEASKPELEQLLKDLITTSEIKCPEIESESLPSELPLPATPPEEATLTPKAVDNLTNIANNNNALKDFPKKKRQQKKRSKLSTF